MARLASPSMTQPIFAVLAEPTWTRAAACAHAHAHAFGEIPARTGPERRFGLVRRHRRRQLHRTGFIIRRLSGTTQSGTCGGVLAEGTLSRLWTIRPAAASDTRPLFELVRTFPRPSPPTAEQFSRALDAKLPDPSSCLFVAEPEGQVVGCASWVLPAISRFYAGPLDGSMNCSSANPSAVPESVDNLWTLLTSGCRLGDASWSHSRGAALLHSTNIAAAPRGLATTGNTSRLLLRHDAHACRPQQIGPVRRVGNV
jgi:hypothetical protein